MMFKIIALIITILIIVTPIGLVVLLVPKHAKLIALIIITVVMLAISSSIYSMTSLLMVYMGAPFLNEIFDNRESTSTEQISRIGEYVDETQMKKDFATIFYDHKLKYDGEYNPVIYQTDEKDLFDRNGNKIIGNGKVLSLDVSNYNKKDMENYIEVYGIIELWLYLNERHLPFEIDGVIYTFIENLKMVGDINFSMTKSEFEDLYNESKVSEVPRDEQVKFLADYWINKIGYVRRAGYTPVKN